MWVILVLATTLAGTECKKDLKNYCLDKHIRYVLTSKKKIVNLNFYCRPGKVIDIDLPEGDELADSPVIGESELFTQRLSEEPFSLQLWPKIPQVEGVPVEQLIGVDTNVIIKLKSGITIVLSVEFGDFMNPQSPYTEKVTFTYPEKQAEQKKVAQIREEERRRAKEELAEQRAELEERGQEIARGLNAGGVMSGDRFFCSDLSRFDREMRDWLEVRGKRICQIGSDIYVHIEVKNLARDNFLLKGVQVLTLNGEGEKQVLESICIWADGVQRPRLNYKERAGGVVVFKALDNTSAEYSIEIIESGGKKRDVVLSGIGF